MGIKKSSPHFRPEETQQYGAHPPSHRFNNDFMNDYCPPGRIKNFSPPTKRLRATWGSNTFAQGGDNASRSTVLTSGEYDRLRAQGKVRAQGVGHEPWRWGYDWPESAKLSAQGAEQWGLSTEPFIDMLLKPLKDRPKTFSDCVNFFYPLSGLIPPDVTISPFISTSVVAYDVPGNATNLGGSIPLQLGEVSMMYGWYLAFRAMLCPNSEPAKFIRINAPGTVVYPFTPLEQTYLQDIRYIKTQADDLQSDTFKLNQIKTAVHFLGQAAQALSSGKFEIPTDIPSLVDAAGNALTSDEFKDLILTHGPAAVASLIRQYVDIPYTHANDLATLVLEGSLSTEKFNSLMANTSASGLAVKGLLDDYVQEQITQYLPENLKDKARGAVGELRGLFTLDTIPSNITDRYALIKNKPEAQWTASDKVIVSAYEARVKELDEIAQSKIEDFAKYGNARPNPVVSSALLIGLTVSAIEGGIAYKSKSNHESFEKMKRYLTTRIARLHPELGTDDIDFILGINVRGGVWETYWYKSNDWKNARLRPTCELQQGGQVLDYWIHTWSRVKRFCQKLDTELKSSSTREVQGFETPINLDFLLPHKRNGLHQVDFTCETIDPNDSTRTRCSDGNLPRKKTYPLEAEKVDKGWSRCQGLGLLASRVDDSIALTLRHMGDFSPFTHAYGFAPTFYMEPATGIMKIDGMAPRRFLGKESMVFKDGKDRFQASVSPANLHPRPGHREAAYDLIGVECRNGQGPLPSRRLLEGLYGQRCNISFDVGIVAEIPVMDAQFCGLMACLLLHPESLDICARFGLPWAVDLKEKKRASQVMLLAKLPQNLIQRAMPKLGPKLAFTPTKNFALLATQPQLNLSKIKAGLSSKLPIVKLTPQLQASLDTLRKDAMLDNIKLHPSVLEILKKPAPVIVPNRQTSKAAAKPELSLTQKVVGATAITAVTAGLSYICYQIYKSDKK